MRMSSPLQQRSGRVFMNRFGLLMHVHERRKIKNLWSTVTCQHSSLALFASTLSISLRRLQFLSNDKAARRNFVCSAICVHLLASPEPGHLSFFFFTARQVHRPGHSAMNLRPFVGIMIAAVVSLSLLELSPTTAQSFVGGPLNPLNLTRVERGTASAFRNGQTVFQLVLPMHLAFDKEKHLCSGFNFHMALHYVEAARLAVVDLVQNSSLLANSSIGFMIHDSCNSAERVVETFAEQTFVSYLQNRQMDCQTLCPNQVGWRRILPLATSKKAVGHLPWFPEYLDPLIGIDSYDLVKIARKSCHAFSIPIVTVSSLLPSHKSQLAGVKSYVHSVVPGGAFDVAAIIDLITRLNLTYVGVIARQYDH